MNSAMTLPSAPSGYFDPMLSAAPMPLETGIDRLPGGELVVAVRTELPHCKGRMLDWWFTFFETTQHIRWWHPHDHVEHQGWNSLWQKGQHYIGASIRAVESLGSIPPVTAQLKFHDPIELFSPGKLQQAQRDSQVSAAIYARIGFGDAVQLDASGDPLDGQMIHLVRDTHKGAVLRSRFVLGLNAQEPVPDEIGLGLLEHCYSEFSYLAQFLPSLYYGEHANGEKAPLPW